MEFLDLLIHEVQLWQWIMLAVLSVAGFIILFLLQKQQSKPSKRKILATEDFNFQYAYAMPKNESVPENTQLPEPTPKVQIIPEDDEESEPGSSPTTSLADELYNKKFGLIAYVTCWILRYIVDIHFPDLWIHSAWKLNATMGILVTAFWLYGILRINKRTFIDHVVNGLLIFWALLLFLVEGGIS